jgi:hypothetical protein
MTIRQTCLRCINVETIACELFCLLLQPEYECRPLFDFRTIQNIGLANSPMMCCKSLEDLQVCSTPIDICF